MAEFEASSKGLFVLFLSLAFVLTSAGALASTIIFDFVSELETTSCWFSDTLLVTDIVLSRLLLLGSALDCLLFSVWIVFSFWIDELEDLVLVSSTVEAGVVSFWKNIYFLSIWNKLFYFVKVHTIVIFLGLKGSVSGLRRWINLARFGRGLLIKSSGPKGRFKEHCSLKIWGAR